MSKLMWVLGILLAAAGIALALFTTISPGRMQAYGLMPDTAAILFVGGVLSLGLGGVINALSSPRESAGPVEAPVSMIAKPAFEEASTAAQIPVRFGRTAAEATAGVAVAGAAMASSAAAKEAPKNSVADTLAALDEAKADIKKALGGIDSMTGHEEHAEPVHAVAAATAGAPPAAEIDAAEAEGVDPHLYVVEEKIIRGRPARILSDDTVEAETDEGWMRFENLDHLNEYLDSTEEPEA
jgi:hypothetical protein